MNAVGSGRHRLHPLRIRLTFEGLDLGGRKSRGPVKAGVISGDLGPANVQEHLARLRERRQEGLSGGQGRLLVRCRLGRPVHFDRGGARPQLIDGLLQFGPLFIVVGGGPGELLLLGQIGFMGVRGGGEERAGLPGGIALVNRHADCDQRHETGNSHANLGIAHLMGFHAG